MYRQVMCSLGLFEHWNWGFDSINCKIILIASDIDSLLWTILCSFFFNLWGGTLGTTATYWPIVPAPDDRWWWLWRNWGNEDWQGKPKYSEKTCPSATLSTKNPTRLDPGFNPGRSGGKPATNRLSYGAALCSLYTKCISWLVRMFYFQK
jgi:hypothetical protein